MVRSAKYINGIEWFSAVRLNHTQMCWLMDHVAQTGIYELQGDGTLGVEDPIYHFDQNASLISPLGENLNILEVSADQTKWVQFLPNTTRWLAEPLQKVLKLLEAYDPPGTLVTYVSPRVLLWIEKGRGSYEYATRQPPSAVNWPQNLPAFSDVLDGQPQGKILLSGKEAEQVQRLFNYRPVGKLFAQNGQEYFVIARPMLPDETMDHLSEIPTPEKDYEPVFTCGG